MNDSYSLLAILIGLSLRLAVPIAVTMLAIFFLRKLDSYWQEQAEHELNQPVAEKAQCWDLKNCPIEKRKTCPAPSASQPCWQVNRLPNGYLREDCLSCVIFRDTPAPLVRAHA